MTPDSLVEQLLVGAHDNPGYWLWLAQLVEIHNLPECEEHDG